MNKKVFFASVIIGFILAATVVTYAKDQDPKQIATVISNTVVTGTVQLDPEYKERLLSNRKLVQVDCPDKIPCKVIHLKFKPDKNAKTVIYKDSAIVNDTIMFEGQKYTLNEKTFKIRVRDRVDRKEFEGGAHVGGAYIMVTKVDKKTVHFVYQHSAFSKEIVFKKALKTAKKTAKDGNK